MSGFWSFMRERKKFWLMPFVFVAVLLILMILLTKGADIAPFIYAVF